MLCPTNLRCALVALAFGASLVEAQVSYTGGTLTQNFDSLPASGSFSGAGIDPADLAASPFNATGAAGWSIGSTSVTTNAKLRADSGTGTTGSHLSYGTGTQSDRALGVLASGSYVGRTGLALVNNTGGPLTQFTITYTGEQWRNGGSGVPNTLTFAYSLTATDMNTGSFTTVPALDFTSPVTSATAAALDGNAAPNRSIITATVSGIPWGVGQTLILRWTDKDDTGNDDGLALDDFSFSAAQVPLPTITRIHTVQGNGTTSPLVGSSVTIEGVVTGDYQGASPALGGFFVQELAANYDADDATSEGIFVDDHLAPGEIDVNVGDVVQVTGTISEVSGVTTITSPTFVVKSGNAAVPAPAAITLPAPVASWMERHEGMLATINQALTVVDNHLLGSDGELTLAVNGSVEVPTESIDPNDVIASGTNSTTTAGNTNVAAVTAQDSLNRRRQIVLNDASRRGYPSPTPFLNAQLTRRCGDTLTSVTGFVSYNASGENRIEPQGSVSFTDSNPRPATAPSVSGRLKAAGMNCLNYFTTLGSRGASTAEELQRQQDKLVAEIIGLNADVMGLMEVENNGITALDTLISAINSALGATVYARVPDPVATGSDLIRVAMIYKPATLTPSGASYSENNSTWSRAPLAVCFTENSSGAKFIVSVNHFKSKSSSNASGADLDQGDGQGAYNDRRKQQAARLITFLANVRTSAGTDQVLLLGDLNSYSQEDPLDVLRAGGYADQTAIYAPGSYSYIFDAARGHLDHALASSSLSSQITGVGNWHINADEPAYLDYSLANKTAAQQAINAGTAYRASDHDPVLVGLTLTPPTITYATWASGIAWNGADSSATADPDHDGVPNMLECITGSNPLVVDPQLRPQVQLSGAGLIMDYRFKQTLSRVTVVPQWSSNLVNWSDLSPGVVLSQLEPTVQLRRLSIDASGQSRMFLRLDVR